MLKKMIASGAEDIDFEEARATFFTKDSGVLYVIVIYSSFTIMHSNYKWKILVG